MGVIPIAGPPYHPVMGGAGQPFEYAVKMRQVDEDLLWDRMSARGDLTPALLDQLATDDLRERMIQRRQEGFVRELHGDLHLRNIALFSRDLPRSLDLLRLYAANRALVRAMVLAIQNSENGGHEMTDEVREFLKLADTYSQQRVPGLYITHGLSGSGETTVTKDLIEILGAVRIRSDIERKRLFGLPANAPSPEESKPSMYGPEGNKMTYDRLKELAESLLKAGYSVIVDAAFLKREPRREFRDLALQAHATFRILDFRTDEASLRERVESRFKQRTEASDANRQVLADQKMNREELTEEERACATSIDPERLRDQYS